MGELCPDAETVMGMNAVKPLVRRKLKPKMNTHLGEVCVGLKQSKKAVLNGEAQMIYLACDADRNIKETFEKLCKKKGIAVDLQYTLAQLGELCSIDVGAAVVAVLKSV